MFFRPIQCHCLISCPAYWIWNVISSSVGNILAASMLRDLRSRFQAILQPDSEHFNPVPAAASLLDPSLAPILLAPWPYYQGLLSAAKLYIVSLASEAPAASTSVARQTDSQLPSTDTPAGLHRFAFLTAKIDASWSWRARRVQPPAQGQHCNAAEQVSDHYWHRWVTGIQCTELLVAAPSTIQQATCSSYCWGPGYCSGIASVCGANFLTLWLADGGSTESNETVTGT